MVTVETLGWIARTVLTDDAGKAACRLINETWPVERMLGVDNLVPVIKRFVLDRSEATGTTLGDVQAEWLSVKDNADVPPTVHGAIDQAVRELVQGKMVVGCVEIDADDDPFANACPQCGARFEEGPCPNCEASDG